MSLQTLTPPAINPMVAKRTQALRVKGKLKEAIDFIVFDGLSLPEAAKRAGMATRPLRDAFAKPHVVAYLKARREVLRASACGKNILRLCEIRDAADNMPAVNAIKVLEQISDTPQSTNSHASSPGLVVIIEAPGASVRTVERAIDVEASET